MSILSTAPKIQLARLLDLFPGDALKQSWGAKGTKSKIIDQIVEGPNPHLSILNFVDTMFGCCRQHIYVCDRPAKIASSDSLPTSLGPAARVRKTQSGALYLAEATFQIALFDPAGDETLSFLWPLKIDLKPQHVVVRFVVMEKNPTSYMAREGVVRSRNLDEKEFVAEVLGQLGIVTVDLHDGVKALWDEDLWDASKVNYKKPGSSVVLTMDEFKGIKATNPTAYAEIMASTLHLVPFKIAAGHGVNLDLVSVDPSRGFVGLGRFADPDAAGEIDGLVTKIIASNS